MKALLCILFLTLYGSVSGQVDRRERIISFHSDILIESTGRVEVAEHITVYGNNEEIRRGIVRRIPVYRSDRNGKKKKVDIKVLSVTRDGQEEMFRDEISDGNRVVYVGSADRYLAPGTYQYVITYESYGHVGFFDDFDELYWNVTGNEWNFPIGKASAAVTLPDDAHYIDMFCYTGVSGSTGSDCSASGKGSRVSFSTTRPLEYQEGLTIAVSFPRDIITRPSKTDELWSASRNILIGLACLTIVWCFYYLFWLKVGKDPQKPVIIPTFKPPHGWSPAEVRYLYKKSFDNKTFTTALVSMAVKRSVRIVYQSKKYILERMEKKEKLTAAEESVYNELFCDAIELTVSDRYYAKFSRASSNLETELKRKWQMKDYFRHNAKYATFGSLVTIAALSVFIILTGTLSLAGEMAVIIPFVLTDIFFITIALKAKEMKGCVRGITLLMGFSFLVPIFLFLSPSGEDWIVIIYFIISLISLSVFIYLIKAPTELGARTAAELDGFRMYLKTAEEHRLNILTPPDKTPELFERLLPYAIALDVENEWGAKFNQILKEIQYTPDWYSSNKAFLYSGFAYSFSQSFGSAIGRAKTDPDASSSSSSGGSWSSGSSGGGSSGGGGGGGGGGGW